MYLQCPNIREVAKVAEHLVYVLPKVPLLLAPVLRLLHPGGRHPGCELGRGLGWQEGRDHHS